MAALTGPGILYVNSKITKPELLSEDAYLSWYDEDHIPEVTQTSGIVSAWRFKDINIGRVDAPYLAMYPLKDLGFLQKDEFKAIRVHSDMLPNGGPIYDLANFDISYLSLVQVFDPTMKGKGHTKTLISEQFEPASDILHEELDRWYREEHLERLTKVEGYLRTTRYKLAYARSNAESRALKGLATSGEAVAETPTWFALHEFSTDELDWASLKEATDSDWSKRMSDNAKVARIPAYKIAKTFGKGEWFHGVEM